MLALNKPVYLENEANAGALGERVFGSAKNVSHLVYISVGMGIGCGLLIENKLFSGNCQQAGEFGHMVVEPMGLRCRCGNRGCWEVYASNSAALRMYKGSNQENPVLFQGFLQKCRAGESEAIKVLETVAQYLGIGIANIINGLNPEMVVIGGELIEVKELIYNSLVKTIKERTLEKSFASVRLEFSQLGNKAVALGMGNIVLDQMLKTEP
jgi:predicted NBD/HSP70 family sugar kinase